MCKKAVTPGKETGVEKETERIQNETIDRKTSVVVWSDRKRIWCGLPWTFTSYRLTEDRLFLKRGFLNLREDEVRLYRIKDLVLHRSLLQRIFGLGTIEVKSSDSSLADFQLMNIRKSAEVKEKLSVLVEEERQRKKVSSREFMSFSQEEENEDLDTE